MINWGAIGAMLIPNVGGWIGSIALRGQASRPDGKAWYQLLIKPSWVPPGYVYGPIWTFIYCSIGYASYMVYKESGGFKEQSLYPLSLYGVQLLLNWTWPTVFYRFHQLGLAVLHLLVLDVTTIACTASFYKVTPFAGYLLVPYLAWLSFATYLNYCIWKLNT